MPALSLVICVYREHDLLARLLRETQDCYDDLVVVHDGPEKVVETPVGSVEQIVGRYEGRFFVRDRSFQQEPHWPFAWGKAKHDWILRLDADEIPSEGLKTWLRKFRLINEPDLSISGYTCVWPLWDGKRMLTKRWPAGRIFLFNRNRVRFFGMAEQTPVADTRFQSLDEILEHRPLRKSFGAHNLLLREQGYHWRSFIAQSLLRKPTDLQCWRWTTPDWPPVWEEIRLRPIRTAVRRLFLWPLRSLRDFWHKEHKILPSAAVSAGIHHCLIALAYWRVRRSELRK